MTRDTTCCSSKVKTRRSSSRQNAYLQITISYTSCLNLIFVPPPATYYGWEDNNGHLSPIWTEVPRIPPIREHAQDVPITFIANEDIKIVESNDGEGSENDDEDVSTDASDNNDSDWKLRLELSYY